MTSWSCVTDISCLSTYGSTAYETEMSIPPTLLRSMALLSPYPGHLFLPAVKAKILKLTVCQTPDPNRSASVNFVHLTVDCFTL